MGHDAVGHGVLRPRSRFHRSFPEDALCPPELTAGNIRNAVPPVSEVAAKKVVFKNRIYPRRTVLIMHSQQFSVPRRRLLGGLVVALLSAALPVVAQPKATPKFDGPSALNKAFRQPMLADRITKSFTSVGQNVLAPRSRRPREEAIKEFEAALQDLP